MRQQLIQWFVDDLTPRIKESRNPEGEIIKFATAKNLPSELVRALGQIHNSAKTVAWLDKHAGSKRGADFPLVDVDAMTTKYLEVRPDSKAAASNEWVVDPVDSVAPSLTWCLAPDSKIETVAQHSGTNFISNQDLRKAAAAREDAKLTFEFAREAEFDLSLKRVKCASEIERSLRENPEIDFTKLSADLLAMYGDGFRPELEHLGRLLCSRNWTVKVAAQASAPDLYDYPADLMLNINAFRDLGFEAQAARELMKEASSTMEPPPATEEEFAEATRRKEAPADEEGQPDPKSQAGAGSRQNSGQSNKGSRPSGNQAPQQGGGGGGQGGGKKNPAPTGFFGSVNNEIDSLMGFKPSLGGALAMAQKHLLGGPGNEQARVDREFADAKHMALLQRLLTTDEVLSTADPDKVVEIFNTVRENSPDLAADPNVMRVFLRMAIQHDGISPFDLKNLLDTQISRHKVDAGLKQQTGGGKAKELALPKPGKDE